MKFYEIFELNQEDVQELEKLLNFVEIFEDNKLKQSIQEFFKQFSIGYEQKWKDFFMTGIKDEIIFYLIEESAKYIENIDNIPDKDNFISNFKDYFIDMQIETNMFDDFFENITLENTKENIVKKFFERYKKDFQNYIEEY